MNTRKPISGVTLPIIQSILYHYGIEFDSLVDQDFTFKTVEMENCEFLLLNSEDRGN